MGIWGRLFGRGQSGIQSSDARAALPLVDAGVHKAESQRALPTVKRNLTGVTSEVNECVARTIRGVDELTEHHFNSVYEAALVSIGAGGDMGILFRAISGLGIPEITKKRAEDITRLVHNRARSIIDRQQQLSMGLTHAIWMHSGAPCYSQTKSPSALDRRRNAAHKNADGRNFDIRKGMTINGEQIWPGEELGCRCTSRAVIPDLE